MLLTETRLTATERSPESEPEVTTTGTGAAETGTGRSITASGTGGTASLVTGRIVTDTRVTGTAGGRRVTPPETGTDTGKTPEMSEEEKQKAKTGQRIFVTRVLMCPWIKTEMAKNWIRIEV